MYLFHNETKGREGKNHHVGLVLPWNRCWNLGYLEHRKITNQKQVFLSSIDIYTIQWIPIGVQLRCPDCGDTDSIVKAGVRRNKSGRKQMYLCKRCNKKFTLRDEFYRKRFPWRVITHVVVLRSSGNTVMDIRQSVERTYNLSVSHTTIYNWLKEFDEQVAEHQTQGSG